MNAATTILILLASSVSAPPQAPPVRSAPTQAPALRTDYALAFERVRAGETVTISVGETAKDKTTITIWDAPRSLARGKYRCWRGEDGLPKYERIETVVVTTSTVKGHSHRCPVDGTEWSHRDNDPNASHNCPTCGRMVLDKARSNVPIPVEKPALPLATAPKAESKAEPTPPTVLYPLTNILPQRSNCPDGNCPTSPPPTRRGWFR